VIVVRYFDPAPRIWLTSIGLSALVGTGLYVSTAACGANSVKLKFWQIVRLYLTPFCVSSFSALVKDRNFILVVSPQPLDSMVALSVIGAFVLLAYVAKKSIKVSAVPQLQRDVTSPSTDAPL